MRAPMMFAILLGIAISACATAQTKVPWLTDMKKAEAKAKQSGKPILLFIFGKT